MLVTHEPVRRKIIINEQKTEHVMQIENLGTGFTSDVSEERDTEQQLSK